MFLHLYGMKDRIKHLMDYKKLSAAELADLIGVQRSNVSHVINGRNNPSSVFIEKLLLTFPDLNARWLITGEGLMLDEEVKTSQVRKPVDLFSGSVPAPEMESEKPKAGNKRAQKNIERIVILYDDKSFRDYQAEN